MTHLYRLSSLLIGLLLSAVVCAADIQVEGAWARATVPGQDVGMVSLTITSKQVAKLIGIFSTACGSVEMHSMTHDNGMMKMREVKVIALPAGKRVDLAESGYHLMLVGLKDALKQGDSVPLTLRIKQANQRVAKIKVFAEVKSIAASQASN
jgi:copper(I)-binding protein